MGPQDWPKRGPCVLAFPRSPRRAGRPGRGRRHPLVFTGVGRAAAPEQDSRPLVFRQNIDLKDFSYILKKKKKRRNDYVLCQVLHSPCAIFLDKDRFWVLSRVQVSLMC